MQALKDLDLGSENVKTIRATELLLVGLGVKTLVHLFVSRVNLCFILVFKIL